MIIQSIDLSNDSYSTVNMGLEDGASPHSGRGSYIHGNGSPPPYLSSHSPPPIGPGGHSYATYPDNIVYTSLRKYIIIHTSVVRLKIPFMNSLRSFHRPARNASWFPFPWLTRECCI